ncbi:uncharacterized protein K460DRAFT_114843 [Cucurbitaria berberidis CBS 394.84]|uniref:Uncharacterized protein n=1 Tax=Cucurbitaria berberidis CBS 394.84 TaxID=1168544 RepID=A0A9P4GHK0_9PLEO|nr:uncharacterized protein K460DRAFT_114843 [Cucurbitaria berberidis CBS 394.84]KAF1845762.1 hypothetical protein K460DRAFT_114843 [Cucurbitaria berberidis CBS 394.84]
MSNETSGDTPASNPDADLAQAFKELQRGEHTAAALENHLDSLEKKIEELLAQAEKAEQEMKDHPSSAPDSLSKAEGKSS